jgi:hypothetical protein
MMAALLLFGDKERTVSIMSTTQESSEKMMKPALQPNATNQAPNIFGVIGLICSIIDLISITILGLLIAIEAESFMWGVEPSILYAGIVLGAVGVVLGFIGAIKDKDKSSSVVATIAGCIAIAMIILI